MPGSPTAITGGGYSTAEINEDCLDSPYASTRPGRKTLSPFTIPFIVQDGSEIHEWLLNTADGPSELLPFALALSNGVDDPVLCECSRESLAGVMRAVFPRRDPKVELLGGVLRGDARCRLRVTLEKERENADGDA